MPKVPPLATLSANPLAQRAVGSLRKGHRNLTSRAIETVLLEGQAGGQKRLSLPRKILGFALMRVATRSVPGAILVGGALLAKHLHDKKKAHDAPTGTERAGRHADSPLLTPEKPDKKPGKKG